MESFSTQEEQKERPSETPNVHEGVEAFRLSSPREGPKEGHPRAPDESTAYLKSFLRKGNKDLPTPAPDEAAVIRSSSGKSPIFRLLSLALT